MTTRELNTSLRDRARELGLCDQWYSQWDSDCTRKELMEKYLRGIDFCIKHDYPKRDFIKYYFPADELHANGIYVDEEFELSEALPATIVILGSSKGTIRVDGFRVSNIYLCHNCDVKVEVTVGSKVFVETYGESALSITSDLSSKAIVYRHGGDVSAGENVIVKERGKPGERAEN